MELFWWMLTLVNQSIDLSSKFDDPYAMGSNRTIITTIIILIAE